MNEYRQAGAYSIERITNQMLPNGMTRVWVGNKMFEVITDSAAVRPKMECMLWKPGKDESDFSKRASSGSITGKTPI